MFAFEAHPFLYTMIIIILLITVGSSFLVVAGHDKWERLIGFSLVSAKINMAIVLFSLITERSFYLDIALVLIILSYIGVKVIADFMIEKKRKGKRPHARDTE